MATNYEPIGTPGGTNYWDQSGTPKPAPGTVTDITSWPMTPGPGLPTGGPQVPVSGGDNPYIPPPYTPNPAPTVPIPAAPQGGGRFGEWLGKVQDWTPDVEGIRTQVAAARGIKNPEDVSEKELMDALVSDMIAKTGATGYLTPMYIQYLRNQASTGNWAGERALQNLGSATYGQTAQPSVFDMPAFMKAASAGTYGNVNAGRTPSSSMAEMWNIRQGALGHDLTPGSIYSVLADNPAGQAAIVQAHLRNLGYSGMWGNYLGNLTGQAYSDWTSTPVSDTGYAPTYVEYLDRRMPQGRTWYPGF